MEPFKESTLGEIVARALREGVETVGGLAGNDLGSVKLVLLGAGVPVSNKQPVAFGFLLGVSVTF